MMDHRLFKSPLLGWVYRLAKVIPVAPRSEDPALYDAAFEAANQVLAEGDLLGIFPEGGLTLDGTLQPFKGGVLKVVERRPVPVVPMALVGLWGSFFSRVDGGSAMRRPFRRGLFNRVALVAGPALTGPLSTERLHAEVQALLNQGPAA
jgi:1-acyl-sn-glycerol-3-phosphate acyltransferase